MFDSHYKVKMLVRKLDIERRIYIPPCICFEEIEADEREMLLAGSDHEGSVDDYGGDGEGQGSGEDRNSLDLDFSMDFVVNNDPQL